MLEMMQRKNINISYLLWHCKLMNNMWKLTCTLVKTNKKRVVKEMQKHLITFLSILLKNLRYKFMDRKFLRHALFHLTMLLFWTAPIIVWIPSHLLFNYKHPQRRTLECSIYFLCHYSFVDIISLQTIVNIISLTLQCNLHKWMLR